MVNLQPGRAQTRPFFIAWEIIKVSALPGQGFPHFSCHNFLDKNISLAHIAFEGIDCFLLVAPKGIEREPEGSPENTGSAFRREGLIFPSMEVRKEPFRWIGGI
ncbi:MAG: hypothetical protein AMJ94_15695 [Deltaproteobacteria bacterium SM23_61]|nr:MAG: hypothetical protein AMJ94_15695 [Deltaproteobacteria bacterium SM23_61]